MKKILLITLIIPILSCGVKKELETAQQEKIELEKRLSELEKRQAETRQKNEELAKQNEEYRQKINLLRAKDRPIQIDVPLPPEHAPKVEKIFSFVEESPEFPGGEEKLMKFLTTNLKYPQIARENAVEGNVYVKFIIEKDGSITNIQVARGIGYGCDQEAVRVVKTMPKWEPGKQRGTPVRSRFILPFKFKLN